MPASHLPEHMDVLSNIGPGWGSGDMAIGSLWKQMPSGSIFWPYLFCGAEIAHWKLSTKFPTSVSPPGFRSSLEHWSLEVENRCPTASVIWGFPPQTLVTFNDAPAILPDPRANVCTSLPFWVLPSTGLELLMFLQSPPLFEKHSWWG